MQMSFRIGIDIGTTSTKAVLYDGALGVRDTEARTYPTIRTEEGMAEQDPEVIFCAVVNVLCFLLDRNDAIRNQVKSVSFSSAMHSLLLISADGKPLTSVYTWADNRSNRTLKKIADRTDLSWIYKRTGTPIHSMSPLSKLMWLKEERSSLLAGAERIVGIKEYITYRLTGEWKIDYSLASATGLFNLELLDWDKDILEFVGVTRKAFSEPVDTEYVFTRQDKETYVEAGLPLHTKLVIGASDGCLANLGLNAVGLNEVAMTIGTSGALRMVSDHIVLDPKGRTFCYYLSKDKWVIGGAVNNGGNAFEWLAKTFSMDYDKLNALAEEVVPGSDGLLFYPYLNGERSPLWDASVNAHFIGIDVMHSSGHFARALMEGVLFNLAEVLHILETFGGKSSCIKVTGGFLHSHLWKQMTANIFSKPISLSSQFESSCLGAVLVGELHNKALLETLKTGEEDILPDEAVAKEYKKSFELYQALSIPLKEMHQIKESFRMK